MCDSQSGMVTGGENLRRDAFSRMQERSWSTSVLANGISNSTANRLLFNQEGNAELILPEEIAAILSADENNPDTLSIEAKIGILKLDHLSPEYNALQLASRIKLAKEFIKERFKGLEASLTQNAWTTDQSKAPVLGWMRREDAPTLSGNAKAKYTIQGLQFPVEINIKYNESKHRELNTIVYQWMMTTSAVLTALTDLEKNILNQRLDKATVNIYSILNEGSEQRQQSAWVRKGSEAELNVILNDINYIKDADQNSIPGLAVKNPPDNLMEEVLKYKKMELTHELGHLLHALCHPMQFNVLAAAEAAGGERGITAWRGDENKMVFNKLAPIQIDGKVIFKYGADSPRELVAELFVALVSGELKISENTLVCDDQHTVANGVSGSNAILNEEDTEHLMRLYLHLGGPRIQQIEEYLQFIESQPAPANAPQQGDTDNG